MASFTSDVARLHRAGSEHSRWWKKLDEAARSLVRWLGENGPIEEDFPESCRIREHYSNGQQFSLVCGKQTGDFSIQTAYSNTRQDLIAFCELITRNDWLNKVSQMLEEWTGKYKEAADSIQASMKPSESTPS